MKSILELLSDLKNACDEHTRLQQNVSEFLAHSGTTKQVTLLEAVQLVADMRLNYCSADDVRRKWPVDGRLNLIDPDVLELAIQLVFKHKYDFYTSGGLKD